MNLRAVARILGIVLLLLAGFLLLPALVALLIEDPERPDDPLPFLGSALISAVLGGALAWSFRGAAQTRDGRPDFFRREGLAAVGLSWLVGGVAGSLPYLLAGTFDRFVDALFESVSGLTTTGSTVMSAAQIDGMPLSIAFWRSFSHWIGGFGIVLVFVVLFPTGGRSLFRSEVPGVRREAGHRRVRDSVLGLLRIYCGITVIEFALLIVAGMTPFDSLIHTLGTVPTGGFSNHSESIGFFHQNYPLVQAVSIELVLTLFMFICGFNFQIYDTLIRVGVRPAWRSLVGSSEARTFVGIVVGSTLVIALTLWFWGGSNGRPAGEGVVQLDDYRSFWQCMRDSMFQVVCISTSTGYGTANFETWPQLCRMILMLLAVIGACAGSTGGGIKVVRVIIVAKAAVVGVAKFVRPRAVHTVRMDGQQIGEGEVASVTGYFALWILVFLAGTLVLSSFGFDLVTCSTAVLATLNNIGPGLNVVGPMMNFAEIPEVGKLMLTVFMILGRLEFYAVVALVVPGFWRR